MEINTGQMTPPEGYAYPVRFHGWTVRFATKEVRDWWLKLHPKATGTKGAGGLK